MEGGEWMWGQGAGSQGQLSVNRLNGRKSETFKVRGIFNEFAQKLIFHCNLLFICSWRHVPGKVRVRPQRALSRPPLTQTTPQSPGKMVFQQRQILSCLGLRGKKAVCSKKLAFHIFTSSKRQSFERRLERKGLLKDSPHCQFCSFGLDIQVQNLKIKQ